MSAPRVSVLLPAFNALATLPRAVASLREQTFADWELLVVDDGSTDGTAEWLLAQAAQEPRLKVISQPHAGIVAALNRGLAEARGEFIARMDADDESFPDRLAEQIAFLDAQPDIGVVSSLVEFAGDRAASQGYALHVDWLNSVVEPEQISLNRFVESPFAHPSVMFRRELVARHGGYRDGDFPEDYELWLRWLEAGVRMAKVPRELLRWHDRTARLSRTDPRYDVESFYRLKADYLARWLKQHVPAACSRRSAGLMAEGSDCNSPALLVWGAGRATRKRVKLLEAHGIAVSAYVDVDPNKHGRSRAGHLVLAPEQIPPGAFHLGYVARRGAREFCRNFLEQRGGVEGRDFLFVA
ncbi:MAG: glycosyl transferase family protein [Limisphaerales bacterium]|nr:MAG: glycosyl transferase family protein [Limisphaerales bacterium]KAG0509189.1 MAG: glycosyl transferase family protein [Limisphaerales bacterium]TXT52471.1 MAG: glycosyl transferase family protein [Limisphaerales bacterium]